MQRSIKLFSRKQSYCEILIARHETEAIWSLLQRWLPLLALHLVEFSTLEEALEMISLSLSLRQWMAKSLDHMWKPNFHDLNHLFLNKSDISGLPFNLWLANAYALLWHWFAQTLCNFCTSTGEQKPSGVQWCLLELKSYKMNLLASG